MSSDPVPFALRAAQSHGLCPRCTLRLGYFPPALLHEGKGALDHLLATHSIQPPPAPSLEAPPKPCPMCMGSLSPRAKIRVSATTKETGSTSVAANSWGGTKGRLQPTKKEEVEGDLVERTLALVATSGFDLRDGITIKCMLSHKLTEGDSRGRLGVSSSMGVAGAPRDPPPPPPPDPPTPVASSSQDQASGAAGEMG